MEYGRWLINTHHIISKDVHIEIADHKSYPIKKDTHNMNAWYMHQINYSMSYSSFYYGPWMKTNPKFFHLSMAAAFTSFRAFPCVRLPRCSRVWAKRDQLRVTSTNWRLAAMLENITCHMPEGSNFMATDPWRMWNGWWKWVSKKGYSLRHVPTKK